MLFKTTSSVFLKTVLIFAVVATTINCLAASKEEVLQSFNGRRGNSPVASVIFDAAGNLYGTTMTGGAGKCRDYGCGTVFELTRGDNGQWTTTVLHEFNGEDGARPSGSLTLDAEGNLYGTTYGGGFNCPQGGCGTVFKLRRLGNGKWSESVLHKFRGTDGENPASNVIFDGAGNLYGTTAQGPLPGYGTVFELTPDTNGKWSEKVLHYFNGNDGDYPVGLISDAAGNLYGTTLFSGPGAGIAFELVRQANGRWTEKILHRFFQGTDDSCPSAALVFDDAGNLFGTSDACGIYGFGKVFELTPRETGKWEETTIYEFSGGNDGAYPEGGVTVGAAGNLYGTTIDGGKFECIPPSHCGTVFKLTPGAGARWTESVLHAFDGTDGYGPEASVILDTAGNLYGTTAYGGGFYGNGNGGYGTVFEIVP